MGHCQVDENHVDRPPRYWALARREPTMLGIKNSRQLQLNNTPLRPRGHLVNPLPPLEEETGVRGHSSTVAASGR